MLQKFLKVTLKTFPPDLDNIILEVGIEIGILKKHGVMGTGQSIAEKKTFIGAIVKDFPNLHQPFTCDFVQVKVYENIGNHENLDSNFLYVSDEFLRQHNMSYDDVCYFKSMNCYPMEKVLLGTKTIESLDLFQNTKKFSALVQLIGKHEVLCCQGELPLMPSEKGEVLKLDELLVLDCEPFRQGLVSVKTSVVLADMHEDIGRENACVYAEGSPLDKTKILDLINYTSNNFLSSTLSEVPRISSSAMSLMKAICLFEIQIIPQFDASFERELSDLGKHVDPLNTVFVSSYPQTFFKVKNGDWVEIALVHSDDAQSPGINHEPKETVRRLAHVCIVSSKKLSECFRSSKASYISPLLWFNLNKHPSLLIQPETRLQIKPLDANFVPPYAEEAYACLVQSPNYDGKVDCKALMKAYFSIPRFVCKGDIFALNSKGQLDFHSKILDEDVDKLKWPVVYFQVTSVSGIGTPYGHLISSHHTLLYQSGTKQSYVPVTMETYYQLSSYHPIWNGIPNGFSQYIEELQAIILPFLTLRKKNQVSPNFLFTGPPCCGKTTVVRAVCRCLNLHLYQVNCHELAGETSASVENKLKIKILKGTTYAPCVILLKNVHIIGREREGAIEDSRVIYTLADTLSEVNSFNNELPILVIGTATDSKLMSNNLVSSFLHSIQMMAPNENERCLILEDLTTACVVGNDVSVRYLAQRTAGFVLGDLTALINQGIKNSYCRINKFVENNKVKSEGEEDIVFASVPVVQKDLVHALEALQSEFADAIGAPKIPNVKFEDVGGLARVKQEILDTIQLPLEHPEILTSGLRRSGVLLYGPPGSGKTLLAKAVATECSLNFLSVKGPELINMYVGQSEENVRAVFQQARSAVPCIIFFDELDSLAPNRGRSGDSGGVMDRVVSQLLAELDGLNKKCEVFVIGATNRPDLIDPALLRPGRFDHLLYVGIPEDHRSKLSILKALTRKFPLAPDVNLSEIVKKCPPHLSGADFYSLCSNAVIQRMEKNVELIEIGGAKIEDLNCAVTTEDFMSALSTLVPSVTPEQYMEYLAIKAKIERE